MTVSVCMPEEYPNRYSPVKHKIPDGDYSFRMDTFGARIKAARELRGWSQEELGRRVAAMLGRSTPVRKAAVSKWELGDTRLPEADVVDALARIFDIPWEMLLWGPDRKPPSMRRHAPTAERKPPVPRE
jgi:transcriptional regulator with XRE-family HTH domain